MVQALMIQGTASDAGKSILAAGFCRIFYQDGKKVVPFKSQNMALNSFITATGEEMGRAQVFQSEAAGIAPDVRMNPVLLKPTTDRKSQVVFLGKILKDMDAVDYHDFKLTLLPEIKRVYNELAKENDVIVLEGAGSPAEINLNDRDIVNMGMAQLVNAPVILVADIDKGGVFATIYGTIELLKPEEKARVKGIIINKFRGDKKLLQSGIVMIEELTSIPVIGVMPYISLDIDEEDSVVLQTKNKVYDSNKDLDVAVISLTRMSNFTDVRSLEQQPDVSLRYVKQIGELGQPDIIILPGSKNTLEEAIFLEKSGLDKAIKSCHQKGSQIIGICGGYQLLGTMLEDTDDTGRSIVLSGIGLLPIRTTFQKEKVTTQVKAVRGKYNLEGYEIHMGVTSVPDELDNFASIVEENGQPTKRKDGVVSSDGSIIGTYLHGVFDNVKWCRDFLNKIRIKKGLEAIEGNRESITDQKEREYDKLAQAMRENIDMDKIYKIMKMSEDRKI